MKRHLIVGDVKKAFLQIRVKEEDRDAQRILWYNNLEDRNIVEYRLTRVIFGAGPNPYILGATLQKHVSQYKDTHPETAMALLQDTYVDDIQYGGDSEEDLRKFKKEATQIMEEGGFLLHKWHSDILLLESEVQDEQVREKTLQEDKQLVKEDEKPRPISKILGIQWDKERDALEIHFGPSLTKNDNVTKRKMLAFINGIYDILGWVAPVTITAKILFSEVCLRKLTWDEAAPDDIQKGWNQWMKRLNECPSVSVPRSVVNGGEGKLSLKGFADASKLAVCASIYVVITYSDGNSMQNLLVSKSRIAPKDVSIPRLELVAAHMLAKLMSHVQGTLCITGEIDLWSDSMTVLYWLASKGTWSKYVRNRVKAIRELGEWRWHYIPTDQNPSDMGTRGLPPAKLGELRFKGPQWLAKRSSWPAEPEIIETDSAAAEGVPRRKEHILMEQQLNQSDSSNRVEWANALLGKYPYWKLLRITAYIERFANNCKTKEKLNGPLKTEELCAAETYWVKYAQESHDLNNGETELGKDGMGIWRCYGRIEGYYPIFIPKMSPLATQIVEHFHELTLHGGVQSTMGQVREKFWVPQLRRLVKSVRYRSNKCKKLRAKVKHLKGFSILPKFRTELSEPFHTIGIDFAGPLYYKASRKNIQKAYVILFTCATTRAVHLTLCRSMTVEEFKGALKWFIARRGRPHTIVTDNAKTFKAARSWLESLQNSEDANDFLAKESIKWKFNHSRAPWWGGFFERLIGVMKSALSKVIGNAMLSFQELEDTLLSIELFMNNRPLTYIGEEFEKPAITPNILIRGERATLLEESDEAVDATKRLQYIKKCKEQLRKRWVNEYLKALAERKQSLVSSGGTTLKNGRVVLIKDSVKCKGKWRLGRIENEVVGKDGHIRGYKIRTRNGYVVEKPTQLVQDLEIGGEVKETNKNDERRELNPRANEFVPKRRGAKDDAKSRITGIRFYDDEED